MAFLYNEPAIIVPILLGILVIIIFIVIIIVAIRNVRERRRKMSKSVRKMKELSTAVSNLDAEEQEKMVKYNRDLLNYTPKKAEKQKEDYRNTYFSKDIKDNIKN